ncbi:hypothetical protein PHYBOEH_005231 [Phytophthora boehmeriae]|uniref:Cyclic nucleotide-binding domain-containing protein n=1 Tax=Phytophthora boehmeriae TaxID=109152 RepID=A0A8T1WPW9_9STRA|nr:hypothetical protein PHYBOEH_005231 [Phytophthora boehmeriae]
MLVGRSLSSGTLASKGLLSLSDPAEFTNFEKCIHLKASHLMGNLDDDKVSLVAQLSRVMVLGHGDALYSEGAKVESVYVIIDGTVEITSARTDCDTDADAVASTTTTTKMHDGDCFGEESFVPNAMARGVALALGRCTLFEIATKELIELSELHHDIMHVLLAWLSQTLAESTKTMIAPLLSPASSSAPAVYWEEEEDSSELRNRAAKWRAETD